jgi:hypothetical protein
MVIKSYVLNTARKAVGGGEPATSLPYGRDVSTATSIIDPQTGKRSGSKANKILTRN